MLFVDQREPQSLQEMLYQAMPTCVTLLESGDFLLFDHDGHSLGIERKTASDLLGSLAKRNANGEYRLKDQLTRMGDAYTHRMLMIEGMPEYAPGGYAASRSRVSRWNYSSVLGIVWDFESRGVFVIVTDGKAGSVEWLRNLHRRAEEGCVLPKPLRINTEGDVTVGNTTE